MDRLNNIFYIYDFKSKFSYITYMVKFKGDDNIWLYNVFKK